MQKYLTNQDCMNFECEGFQTLLKTLDIQAIDTGSRMAPNYDFIGSEHALEYMLKESFAYTSEDIAEMEMIEEYIDETPQERMLAILTETDKSNFVLSTNNMIKTLIADGFEEQDIRKFLIESLDKCF